MRNRLHRQGENNDPFRSGVVLLITLVILVILATLGYTLSARVAARRHRDQYMIDYGQARYACASALKYALASAGNLEPELISRPNDPDFSDVFAMSELEYQELLIEYGLSTEAGGEDLDIGLAGGDDSYWGDTNDSNDFGFDRTNASEAELPTIRGPYGPPWPLVDSPLEFEIGSARVKIEIEDENAKYPLGWALIDDEKLQPLADVGFVTFCEWMAYGDKEIRSLREDLTRIGEIRTFKTEFKPVTQTVKPTKSSVRSRASSTRSSKTPVRRTATQKKTISAVDQIAQQSTAFAKLFHSSFVDAELLSRPSVVAENRKESAMKYLGLWAARKVNVNSAPRHVLEAALTFGSVADAPKIAEAIIQQRREKPFTDIEELKTNVFEYSDSIEKCKDFLTTASTDFLIRATATSGVATVTAVAAVVKEGDKVKEIGVISD